MLAVPSRRRPHGSWRGRGGRSRHVDVIVRRHPASSTGSAGATLVDARWHRRGRHTLPCLHGLADGARAGQAWLMTSTAMPYRGLFYLHLELAARSCARSMSIPAMVRRAPRSRRAWSSAAPSPPRPRRRRRGSPSNTEIFIRPVVHVIGPLVLFARHGRFGQERPRVPALLEGIPAGGGCSYGSEHVSENETKRLAIRTTPRCRVHARALAPPTGGMSAHRSVLDSQIAATARTAHHLGAPGAGLEDLGCSIRRRTTTRADIWAVDQAIRIGPRRHRKAIWHRHQPAGRPLSTESPRWRTWLRPPVSSGPTPPPKRRSPRAPDFIGPSPTRSSTNTAQTR